MKKDEKKPIFIICPRCELNYITKKDKLCTVCKAEMGLVDKSILIPDEEEVEKICPVCKVNLIDGDEDICFVCQKERLKEPPEEKTWPSDDEIDEDIVETELDISLELTAEEEDMDEVDEFKGPDDLDYEDEDDFDDDFDDDDFDDDEDEDEDDEDEDDDED